MSLPRIIIRFDNLFSYDNMETFSQGWTSTRSGGFVDIPPEITLTIVFLEEPTQLLKCATTGHMFDKVTLDCGEGRSVEFVHVIINRCDHNDGRYTVHMLALRVIMFRSEQEKREFNLIGLITTGQIFIGFKK